MKKLILGVGKVVSPYEKDSFNTNTGNVVMRNVADGDSVSNGGILDLGSGTFNGAITAKKRGNGIE